MGEFRYEKDADGIATITMDLEGSVNKWTNEFFELLAETLDRLEEEKVTGAIFTSAKSTFIVGADLNRVVNREDTAAEIYAGIQEIKARLRRLELLGVPVVAAVNGSSAGGGVEFGLACGYRIALDKPGSVIGLPEVTLGYLPGGGGTTRMIHLHGAEKAVPYLLEGKLLKPQKAQGAGLVDEVVATPEEMMARAREWIKANPDHRQPWDRPGHKIPGGGLTRPHNAQLLYGATLQTFQRTHGAYQAPQGILEVTEQVLTVDFETALRVESRVLAKLMATDQAINMTKAFFFNLQAIRSGASRPKDVPPQPTKKVGVLGGGMMGRAIAYVSSRAGMEVVLREVSMELAEQAVAWCQSLGRLVGEITPTTDTQDLKDCDLIIEAVFEDIELKHEMIAEVEAVIGPETIFASNTSSLPITKLAEASKRPDQFIGIHFFSPAEKMPLIEIIKGKQTGDVALAKAFDYAQAVHKTPIVVNDSPGFFTSRVVSTYIDEGVTMLTEGVHPVRIERLARMAGFPVGPLALMDEVSQVLSLKIIHVMGQLGFTAFANSTSTVVARQLVDEYDRGGRAYGGGFYDYPEGEKKHIWPKLVELYYNPQYEISDRDIQDRLIYRQTVETMKLVDEGVIESEADANIGSIFGIGFPPPTGGVLQYVQTMGPERFNARLGELAEKFGAQFSGVTAGKNG